MDIPVISLEAVTKSFTIRREKALKDTLVFRKKGFERTTTFQAIHEFTTDIYAGSTVGLMGHNGSGKSTLLKLIGGILEANTGTIYRRGRLAALLELGAGFHPDLTGRENVFLNAALLGIKKSDVEERFDDIVAFSGVEDFIDTPVKFFSSGMYVRLAFSVAINVDPDILLVDEVLAVGDEPFQKKCHQKIESFQSEGRTIILVSHSAADIERLATRAIVLDQGHMVFDGDPVHGIQALRAGYRREAASDGNAQDVPSATVTLEHVRAMVRRKTKNPDISVVVEYTVVTPSRNLRMEIGIETLSGMRLLVTDSVALAASMPTSVGSHKVTFTFGSVPLHAGVYAAGVALYEGDETESTTFGVCEFEIEKASVGQGILGVVPTIKID
ncbi:MAG: ATP-binding cassette domain-containing protein [Actinobacteria bacterium]|uniref:Unannotated protein n=1 Tax=freshwater metagenome TaxID=449393 RepID=A0A6J7G297_9ZZZZ|nr:ATP-binding cassette domain-containing protein [Actinomycetota bacterium]